MKELELNLERIALLGEQKERENFAFRTFLKGRNSKSVDKIVHRINDEITLQIDCQKCGNCCISLRPCLTESEIDKLSAMGNLSKSEFETKFVEIDKFDDIKYLKDMPCKYLKDKSCSIYSDRPENCRSYPHTQKAEFTSRTFGMIDNYGICPIVFNLYEQLKKELGFRYYK